MGRSQGGGVTASNFAKRKRVPRRDAPVEHYPDEGITRVLVHEAAPVQREDGALVMIGQLQLWDIGEYNYVDWSRVADWDGAVSKAARRALTRIDRQQVGVWAIEDLVALGLMYVGESGDEISPTVEAITRGIIDATGARMRTSNPVVSAWTEDAVETPSGVRLVNQAGGQNDGDAPRPKPRKSGQLPDPSGEMVSTRVQLDRIWRAAELSPREGEWLWWHHVEGYEQGEIASIAGVHPSTVSRTLDHALRKLKSARPIG